ncbi:MAG: hypothetical protein Q8P15_00380 [Nanoarchaeota archaeon]|nr:hypothetical protein [Nanoarchaeota archaeon]
MPSCEYHRNCIFLKNTEWKQDILQDYEQKFCHKQNMIPRCKVREVLVAKSKLEEENQRLKKSLQTITENISIEMSENCENYVH